MKTKLLFLTSFVLLFEVQSQTNVSGGIYSNTTWTKANSPYIVTDTVVVFPNNTLTIEPGVTIKFNDNKIIEIRQSSIIAVGNMVDSIIFTSSTSTPSKGIWGGLFLSGSNYSQFNYCSFSFANKAINPSSLYDTLICRNSIFDNNIIGIGSVYYTELYIDSCIFSNNNYGIKNATTYRAVVSNSAFFDNQYGLYKLENILVKNCFFQGNSNVAIWTAQGDTIINCAIINNDTAIGFGGYGLVTQNIIENNNYGLYFCGYGWNIYCNKICNNSFFDLKYYCNYNSALENNNWCSNDSAIISNKIYDGYDNISLGLVDYIPFDTTQCYIASSINDNKPSNSFLIYPNPFSSETMLYLDYFAKNALLTLYDSYGHEVKQIKNITEQTVIIPRNNLSSGLYFLRLTYGNNIISAGKLIITD